MPAQAEGPAPMFAGLNFKGNDATLDERSSSRWPYEQILKAGFGVATAWRDSVEPDGKQFVSPGADAGWFCRDGGVRAWYNPGGDWGAISAWAWGLSRIMDYLETDPAVDAGHVAVIGHSRLGKTSLWAGANDTRFALVISNCSGCCGAAISRRVFGENFAAIDNTFPHWFTREFDKYRFHEELFPADQHWLAALAAPRPLYIVSAQLDGWADPRGEWLCAKNVEPVYRLFQLMHSLDEERLETEEEQGTVGLVATEKQGVIQTVVYNYDILENPPKDEKVTLCPEGMKVRRAEILRIDETHANAYPLWTEMGSPEYPTEAQIHALIARSALIAEPLEADGEGHFTFNLPPQSAAMVRFYC